MDAKNRDVFLVTFALKDRPPRYWIASTLWRVPKRDAKETVISEILGCGEEEAGDYPGDLDLTPGSVTCRSISLEEAREAGKSHQPVVVGMSY